jgi:hypothetical protein
MNPDEELEMRIAYVHALMFYIEQEYENIPDMVTPEMAIFFNFSFDNKRCLPNAAGDFAETFLKATT